MKDFIETIDTDIQDIVENGYELSKILIDNAYKPKVRFLWFEEEWKRHILTFKVK